MTGQFCKKITRASVCLPPVYGPEHGYYLMYPKMVKVHHASRKPTGLIENSCQPK